VAQKNNRYLLLESFEIETHKYTVWEMQNFLVL